MSIDVVVLSSVYKLLVVHRPMALRMQVQISTGEVYNVLHVNDAEKSFFVPLFV